MAIRNSAGRRNMTVQKRKTFVLCVLCVAALLLLGVRVGYLMILRSEHYTELATQLHERERDIKAARGRIIDSTGTVLADNKTVCTISVIHSQLEEPEKVIDMLCRELDLSEEYVRKRVEKYSSRERIKSNVDKETGDRIRNYDMAGVKVDEDYKRYYPYDDLASKVLGFTGGDNQGIIGLEVAYEKYLTGKKGQILTLTDAKGIELDGMGERRKEPEAGKDLYVSIDVNIQRYATQLAKQAYETKQAAGVSIIVMNVNNGEILAMVDVPEFHLNDPYTLIDEFQVQTVQPGSTEEGQAEAGQESTQDLLNRMWRNGCINDIRCHKIAGHGAEDFTHAVMNSCNPVFITVGLRVGAERYYQYFTQFGLKQKTGIDLPGEAGTIVHQLDKIGEVELATMSFGQSFQITPIGLINGGNLVTPHFGVKAVSPDGTSVDEFVYPVSEGIVSSDTTEKLRYALEQVVENGGGKNGYVEGFRVGGKTATSQTLPRGNGRYIASFLGFAPADDPKVMALAIIDTPQGTYYGGQIAAPVVRQLFENILPYLEEIGYE